METEATPVKKKLKGGKRDGAGRPKGYVPANRMLMALRAVSKQEESADKGPLQKAMRELLKTSPRGFAEALGKAEREHRSDQPKKVIETPAGAVSAPVPEKTVELPVDIGTERALELIEELLGEWETRSAQPV